MKYEIFCLNFLAVQQSICNCKTVYILNVVSKPTKFLSVIYSMSILRLITKTAKKKSNFPPFLLLLLFPQKASHREAFCIL